MIHISLNIAQIKLLGDVTQIIRPRVSCLIVMTRHVEGKVLRRILYLPTLFKDAHDYCIRCPRWKQLCRIIRRDMIPLNSIVMVHIFNI